MRVAVETLNPLPFYKCWYLFEETDESTVADLRKSLNREFQLAKKSSHLKLMAGGFEYVPRFRLKNYILENDLVMIGTYSHNQERKDLDAVKENEQAQQEKGRAKDEKKRVKEEKKRAKEEKRLAKEQKRIEKKRKRASEDETESVEAKKPRSAEEPEKMTKTQKRNARKKAARLRQREAQLKDLEEMVEDEAPEPEPVQKQQQEEDQIVASERLLKQNKNKKANFLKEMGKKTRSHFHFDAEEQEEQEQDYYDEEEYTQEQDNAYGSAFVTSVEADDMYTGEKRDYDSLPLVSFTGPFPAENDRLAIKMLEMTKSYTPEISDWKEVKVLSFDQAEGMLTVEFLPGFLLTEHRGKFTLRDSNQAEEEEDEELVEEVLEDQTKQLSQFDVAEMRRL